MVFRLLADAVMVVHAGFIAFVAGGGLLALRHPRIAFIHLPCTAYGILVELFQWTCPLTPLENRLRRLGGEAGYPGGFVEHTLVPLVYPEPFPRWLGWSLAGLVLAVNVAVYLAVVAKIRRSRAGGEGES
jgi:hypothetical protein